jgi:hypothetical protein
MPRARPKQGDQSVILQVSPWLDTKPKHQKSQEDYNATVVVEPLINTSTSSQEDRSTSEQPPQRSLPPPAPPTHQDHHHPAQVGEWHTIHHDIDDTKTTSSNKKSQLDEDEGAIDAATIDNTNNNRDQVDNIDKATSTLTLTGTAFLAVLEDASITGQLIVLDNITNTKTNYGIMGREVVSFRECTRDPDWAVIRLTLINFKTGDEMTFLVEKSGGDAMSLVAPVSWQGLEEEEEMQRELNRGCVGGVEVWFSCEQLLTGSAADKVLRRMKKEELCGRVVVVNQGEFSVVVPSVNIVIGGGGGQGDEKGDIEEEEEEKGERGVIVSKRKAMDDDDDWM